MAEKIVNQDSVEKYTKDMDKTAFLLLFFFSISQLKKETK